MVLWSLRKRRCSFGPWYNARRPLRFRWCSRVSFRLSQLFGRHGVFGIESPHYHIVHLIRQVVEVTLQSYQAYRMSQYISRVWLNQLYVGLIILSCWSIPLVKRIKARDPLRQRMLIILWDVLLDLVASIGISVVLLYSYLPDFDLANRTVWYYLWFNSHWVVHAISESQLMLVQSRMDLLTRATFSLGLLWCLENLKDIFESTHWRCSEPQVRPLLMPAPTSAMVSNSLKVISARTMSSVKYRDVSWFRMLQRSFQGSLVLWGIILLGLHVHAASRATIRQCSMQVRPWLTPKSACALLVVDCYAAGISGDEREATAVWAQANEGTVLRVLVRHCSKFHMSPQIRAFHELRGLKFYNSTITKWTKDAELTQEAHPNLLTTLFVRTNFTNREIPRGFLSDNFPQRLMDVEFSVTNLRVLPDDVDTKWHKGGTYHFEYSQFDAIPPSILRLQPRQLSFVGNRLTRFPFEVLNVHGLFYLILSSNPISSLSTSPYQHFVDKSSLSRILLSHTNISSLPRWLDQFFLRKVGPRAPLIVVETPMCTGLAAAKSLRLQADDLGVPEDERSLVMNKAAAEVPGFMSCSIPAVAYYYPLSYEDTWNGIAQKG